MSDPHPADPLGRPFQDLSSSDMASAGGRKASLGEMIRAPVEAGIDSISVNPDSVLPVMEQVARAEEGRRKEADPGPGPDGPGEEES